MNGNTLTLTSEDRENTFPHTESAPAIILQGGDTPIGPIHHANPLDLSSMHPDDIAYPIGA